MSEILPAPRDEDVDVYGVTHPGKKRPTNQDHFLIGSIHRRMSLNRTSLPAELETRLTGQAASMLLMVADGVGGSAAGDQASRLAIQALVEYLVHKADACNTLGDSDDADAFFREMEQAVAGAHHAVTRLGLQDPALEGMATTLTAVAMVWPMAYVTQVGDSRCYLLRDGSLQRLTTDQTVGQQLIDSGQLTESGVRKTPWGNVLYSTIGGSETHPELKAFELRWSDVLLLCSDGLTKHVSDAEIEAELRKGHPAEGACETLLQLALDRGGSDNITIVIARLKPGSREEAARRAETTERLYPPIGR